MAVTAKTKLREAAKQRVVMKTMTTTMTTTTMMMTTTMTTMMTMTTTMMTKKMMMTTTMVMVGTMTAVPVVTAPAVMMMRNRCPRKLGARAVKMTVSDVSVSACACMHVFGSLRELGQFSFVVTRPGV